MSRTSKTKARIFGSGGIAEKWDPFQVRSSNGRIVDFSIARARGKLGDSVVRQTIAKQVAFTSHTQSRKFVEFFFEVLDQQCEAAGTQPPATQEEIGVDLATSIILAFKNHPRLTVAGREYFWGRAYALLQKLMNNRLPTRRRHARSTKRRRGWRTYTDEDVQTLVTEARASIAELLARREKTAALREKYSTWDFSVRPSNKEEYIAYWLHRLDAMPLRYLDFEENGHSWFLAGLQRRGLPLFELYRTVYPAPEDAAPFIILLEYIFGLNQRGVQDLETGCIGMVDGRPAIRNNKPRGRGIQFTPAVSTEAFEEAKWLINTFIEISAAARQHVSEEEKCKVWVVLRRNSVSRRKVRPESFIRAMEYDHGGDQTLSLGLKSWGRERGLPEELVVALNSRMRKYSVRSAYKNIVGNDQRSQQNAIDAAADRLNDKYGLLDCYALCIVSESDAIRAINAVEFTLMQHLRPYGVY